MFWYKLVGHAGYWRWPVGSYWGSNLFGWFKFVLLYFKSGPCHIIFLLSTCMRAFTCVCIESSGDLKIFLLIFPPILLWSCHAFVVICALEKVPFGKIQSPNRRDSNPSLIEGMWKIVGIFRPLNSQADALKKRTSDPSAPTIWIATINHRNNKNNKTVIRRQQQIVGYHPSQQKSFSMFSFKHWKDEVPTPKGLWLAQWHY